MIPRYSRPDMAGLWEAENRYRAWLVVEILACEANSRLGLIPAKSLANIKRKADFSAKRIDELAEILDQSVSTLFDVLLNLELKGMVRQMSGQLFARQ